MVVGLVGLGASIAAGFAGASDARKAAALQGRFIQSALGNQQSRAREYRAAYERATPYMDEYLQQSLGLEEDLLTAIDPLMSEQLRRIDEERAMAEGNLGQAFASRGLDSFTTRMGAMDQIRENTSAAQSELAARIAAQRAMAIRTGRQAALSGLGARSDFEMGYGDRRADVFSAMSQINSGVQVQPPNTASQIGQLGRQLQNFTLDNWGF